MKIKFLLDEDLATSIAAAVKRLDPNVDIIRVGAEGAPPLGTSDSDLLLHCEATSRVLVTENRKTMPVHERDHFAA